MKYLFTIVFFSAIFFSCDKGPQYPYDLPGANEIDCDDHPIVSQGKYYIDENEDEFLWAGDDPSTHFKVNNMALNPCNLYYGLGRDHFPALLTTQYEPLSDVIDNFDDIEKTLVLRAGGVV